MKKGEIVRVFIIGSNGYIAKRLIDNFPKYWDYNLVSSKPFGEEIYLNLESPYEFDYNSICTDDFIILLAAISSPDVCENRYKYAYKINVIGTKIFIENCLERGAKVLFFSSDTVYGKQDYKVNENSVCKPLGAYGQMKYEIESDFKKDKNFKVFRLSYVFSKNDKFMKYLKNCSICLENADVFHPIYRNVVYIGDLINAIINIINQWKDWENKIFNICGPQLLSRIDLTNIYIKNVDNKLEYIVTNPTKNFFKARPEKIETNSLYLQRLLGYKPSKINDIVSVEFK